jgi:succinate dehydrogenase/fumarate reductase cytochrome b subunit
MVSDCYKISATILVICFIIGIIQIINDINCIVEKKFGQSEECFFVIFVILFVLCIILICIMISILQWCNLINYSDETEEENEII